MHEEVSTTQQTAVLQSTALRFSLGESGHFPPMEPRTCRGCSPPFPQHVSIVSPTQLTCPQPSETTFCKQITRERVKNHTNQFRNMLQLVLPRPGGGWGRGVVRPDSGGHVARIGYPLGPACSLTSYLLFLYPFMRQCYCWISIMITT